MPSTSARFPGGWSCSPVATAVAGPDGALSTTVAASARVGNAGYCRAQCSISVQSDIGWRDARFAMAEGQVEVAPATGLADGDVVQVAATELQPTYTGHALGPFPTGVAAVAQSAATVPDSAQPLRRVRRLRHADDRAGHGHRVDRRA